MGTQPLLVAHCMILCIAACTPHSFFVTTGRERSAFTDRGGGKLAVPRLLRLKPEDKLLAGSKGFKNGRFTWVTESNNPERWIVASCGRYTVIWNFKK
jgi:hypothetical protein